MSVVNKMLQDLEARKTQADTSADYQASEPERKFPWSLAVILVLLLAAGWYGYVTYLQGITQTTENQSNAQNEEVTESSNLLSANQQQPSAVNTPIEPMQTNQPSKIANVPENNELKDATQASVQLAQVQFSQQPAVQSAHSEVSQAEASTPNSALPLPLATQSKVDNSQAPLPTNDIVSGPMKIRSEAQLPLNTIGSTLDAKPSAEQFNVKSSSEAESESDLRQQIQVALKRGDESTATDLLVKLMQVSPQNEKARKRLAAMLFSQGKRNQADTVIQQGIDLQPDNQELRLMQAKMHVQMKNPTKAHDLLADYPVSAALSPDFVSYRAALAQQVERFSYAQQDYKQLTDNQPANAKWWLGLAVAEERLGHNDKALQAYQNAQQLAQLSVEVEKFVEQRIHYLAGVN